MPFFSIFYVYTTPLYPNLDQDAIASSSWSDLNHNSLNSLAAQRLWRESNLKVVFVEDGKLGLQEDVSVDREADALVTLDATEASRSATVRWGVIKV